jgi:queuine tRNA-ribosyltransferase
MSRLNFQLEATSDQSRARAGRFRTLHNEVLTPLFMPVGTHATVRHQTFDLLLEAGSQILLTNTYHLLLRPGPEVFRRVGGIHNFTQWPRSFLTDSGGFQIFSMSSDRRITEECATFKSYIDGSTHLLSPEASIEMQKAIGSDIMMVLDECVPSTVDKSEARRAMELTHRWAARSLEARGESEQSMFGIIQGACYRDLRRESAHALTQMPFDGFAIGGLAVGETKDEREEFTAHTVDFMPKDRPRYLMGVGTPIDLLEAVHRGVDMFDCIIPTAHGEQGVAYTSQGRLRINRSVYKFAEEPLDPNCECYVCKRYTKAYLHHLIKAGETFGKQLMSSHNIHFYHSLMRSMRRAILENRFLSLYNELRDVLAADDQINPPKKAGPSKKKIPRALNLGDYEVVISPEGYGSIRQLSSGEVMHSVSHPDDEAARLYAEAFQSFQTEHRLEELRVWDVGMGAAHNAMSLVHKLPEEKLSSTSIRIISFERDLDPLRLALKHPVHFKHLRHGAPHHILEKGAWEMGRHSWRLLEGDFKLRMKEAPSPHVVFWDPFSLKTNAELWTLECFRQLRDQIDDPSHPLLLATYSASTAIRAGLLLAGFYVYRGPSTGPKSETTWASTTLFESLKDRLLGDEFLDRLRRSSIEGPFADSNEAPNKDEMIATLLKHPQFERHTVPKF